MTLPRTFVGFSSTDISYYRLMCAWKAHENIGFDFCDCQLQAAINSDNETYIKSRCRERLQMAGTYVLLIGADIAYKERFVLWEAEVAIEKKCRLIGVNLDNWRVLNPARCPLVFQAVDAVFLPFSPQILAWALEKWTPPSPATSNWYFFQDWVYQNLGYGLVGNMAVRPPKPPPWSRLG